MVEVLGNSVRVISSRSVTVGVVSLVLFLWTAVTVVQKLQSSLADMFGVRGESGWRNNGRVLVCLLTIAAIVAVAFFASGALEDALGAARPFRAGVRRVSLIRGVGGVLADIATTFAMYFVVGIAILRLLPGHDLGWKVVRTGALIGAIGWTVLYTIGVRVVAGYLSGEGAPYYGVAVSTLILLITTNLGARITLIAAAWAAENLPGASADGEVIEPVEDDEPIRTAWVDEGG